MPHFGVPLGCGRIAVDYEFPQVPHKEVPLPLSLQSRRVGDVIVLACSGPLVMGPGCDALKEQFDTLLPHDSLVVLDVGGFLGLGERQIAVKMNQLNIVRSANDGDDFRVYVDSDQARLKAQPEYKG